jgi:hypothetical protein
MYRCLSISQPFLTPKGKGLLDAWTTAVADINQQIHPDSGLLVFDPPLLVKTVRDRFDGAMKVIKSLQDGTPFRSGTDDEDPPNEIQQILEDIFEKKNSFDSQQVMEKDNMKEKKIADKKAAKEIQEASLGNWQLSRAKSCSESESSKNKSGSDCDLSKKKTNSESESEKEKTPPTKRRNSNCIGDQISALADCMADRKLQKKLKLELQQQQMAMQEQQIASQIAKENAQIAKDNAIIELMQAMARKLNGL